MLQLTVSVVVHFVRTLLYSHVYVEEEMRALPLATKSKLESGTLNCSILRYVFFYSVLTKQVSTIRARNKELEEQVQNKDQEVRLDSTDLFTA